MTLEHRRDTAYAADRTITSESVCVVSSDDYGGSHVDTDHQ
jgi:hypothetical protein